MKKYSDLDADQLAAIDFILSGEDTLLAADIGTGKTVISLTAAKLALSTGVVNRWLVLAPLLVATDTWAHESKEWEHLSDKDVAIACGGESQRLEAINSDARIVVMNYENLNWLLEQFPRDPRKGTDELPFDGLICDELSKLKSVNSNRFKAIRNRIRIFHKRIGMDGAPVPNELQELWGQVYMVDGGQSFGRSFYEWRKKFFYPIDFNQYTWLPFEKTRETLINTIADLTFRLKAKGLPQVKPLDPALLHMPEEVRGLYDELEREYFATVTDVKGRLQTIDVVSAGALTVKLQQICSGFSYIGEGKKREAVWHSYARFEWLDQVLEHLAGQQVLIFYHFNEELDELNRRFPGLAHLGQGVSTGQKRKYIDLWNQGEIDNLALHPASAGHGLNLQKSGAKHIAFLTLPWSGGLYKQVVGRLSRRGNKAKEILVHTSLFENTIDQNVYSALTGKMDGLETFLNDLETACRFGSPSGN
jgi:SNF2 family DNA or RNA helicase